MRWIIIAAGSQQRWNNHLGVPKHLIPIDGECLLDRTIRLIKERDEQAEIVITGKDARYKRKGCTALYMPETQDHEADKFWNTKPLWSSWASTVIVYGDVFFTEYAMNTIREKTVYDYHFFGRPYGSKVTGCPHGEMFAVRFIPQEHQTMIQALKELIEIHKANPIRIGGWEFYKILQGFDLNYRNYQVEEKHFTIIDDFTDDFDNPDDYNRWNHAWINKEN